MIDELRIIIYAGVGETVVRAAAILLALSAIITVITKALRRSMRMGRDLSQLVEFARTGDNRVRNIEDEVAEMRQALTLMANELARVPELAESVLHLTETVGAEVNKAAAIHDQIAADSLARDEAIVARLEALSDSTITPPHGNPITE